MKPPTNVIWLSYHSDALNRGYWDQAIVEEIVSGERYQHHTSMSTVEKDTGGIVVLNGRMHVHDVLKLNKDIEKLTWCLLIITGDEEASFPWRTVRHKWMKIWVQMPRMNQHNDVHYKLPNGYRPNTVQLLDKIPKQERTLDYFFVGQVTHPRREECRRAVNALNPTVFYGEFIATSKFGEEVVPYEDYLRKLASSKIVLCPSGPETPDSFRLYEALEAGCLPIVDAFASNNQDWGYWKYLYGDDIPFPIISYWDRLPELLDELLDNWPANSMKAFAWWQLKKREIRLQLEADVKDFDRG